MTAMPQADSPHSDTPQTAVPKFGGRSLGLAATVLGLLVFTVIALRGSLPEVKPADRGAPTDSSPATLAGILVMLSASMLITAVALLTRPPRQRPPAPVAPERRFPGGTGGWPIRRLLLLGLAAVMASLLVFLALNQLQHLGIGLPADTPRHPTAPPAAPTPPAASPRAKPDPGAGGGVFGYLAATVAATAVLMVASAVIARRRRRGAAAGRPAAVVAAVAGKPGPEPLVVAAERGLAEVEDLSRGPREAIIACYVAMEQALVDAPDAAPRESDTPSEVLARAVANRALRADSAATLVAVFAEARFSTHTMTEGHREVAERALRMVLDELRSRG